jgi:competence protein ComEC
MIILIEAWHSIFIETPGGHQILIDGGPDGKVLQRLGKIMPFYDHDIDVVIASHPHADHIAGLIDVLKRYNVKNIIEAKEEYNSPEDKAWKDSVSQEGAVEEEAVAGKVVDFGDGVKLYVLHPFKSVAGTKTGKPHNDIVVVMLEYGSFRVLFTGDMETKVERQLILNGIDLSADVLKVGHHGSNTSTSEEFIAEVGPEAALIEVGAKNRYGHPSPDILSRLENFGIKYYRTDLNGDIKLISDGKNYLISAEK